MFGSTTRQKRPSRSQHEKHSAGEYIPKRQDPSRKVKLPSCTSLARQESVYYQQRQIKNILIFFQQYNVTSLMIQEDTLLENKECAVSCNI